MTKGVDIEKMNDFRGGVRGDLGISFCRYIAMNFIVACHVLQYCDNELAWWFNCGVQIFICISGFLYGQRRIDNGYSFIKRRFIKILSSYYVCLLIDVVLLYIFSDQVVDIKDIILMVFCKGTIAGLGHLWFVGTILFCYLLTPILSQVYEFQNRKNFKIEFFSFCVCLCIVVQIHLPQFNPIWILCYICGYSIGKLKLKDEKWLYKASLLFVPTSIIFNIVKIYMKYILKITLKNDALNSLYARYGNLCHLLLGVSLFFILYVIYKKFLQHISGIAHILKLSDKYSYDIYLAHHIYILGPLSILSLQISAFSKIIILIGLISAQSIIVHKASALLNQLKISD